MMLKQKSNPWARLKFLYVLPLAAVTVAAFAHPEISRRLEKVSDVEFVEVLTSQQNKKSIAGRETKSCRKAETGRRTDGTGICTNETGFQGDEAKDKSNERKG